MSIFCIENLSSDIWHLTYWTFKSLGNRLVIA
jgi:hypothetical protein